MAENILDTLGKKAEEDAKASADAKAAKADNDILDGEPKKIDTDTHLATPY